MSPALVLCVLGAHLLSGCDRLKTYEKKGGRAHAVIRHESGADATEA